MPASHCNAWPHCEFVGKSGAASRLIDATSLEAGRTTWYELPRRRDRARNRNLCIVEPAARSLDRGLLANPASGGKSMQLKVPLVAIVEDDELLRSATASLIRSLGLTSVPFRSAQEFLDLEPTAIDCIISDLHMPGMSGLELQETLNARGSQVPFILMTAYGTEQTKARALANGAHCFLEKPCTADVLIGCLEQIFGSFDDP